MTGSDASALLVIDVQNDFCPGGALAVADGDRVVEALNPYLDDAARTGTAVYASRDWHPPVTTHFAPYGGPWPVHCVAGTPGAECRAGLRLPPSPVVITKGQDPERPGYSAFDGVTTSGTSLLADLEARGIRRLYVGGLATDYCVRQSVLDARRAGLDVHVLEDAIAGVEAEPGDSARAIDEMRAAGAIVAPGRGRT